MGNLIHPETPGPIDSEGTARVVAESQFWVPIHLALLVGFLLMLGGLVAIHHSLTGGLPGVLARFGLVVAIVATSIGVVILTIDGFAIKHTADFWLSAPPDLRATALGSFRAVEAIGFALLSPLNLVFAGFTFVLFGLAVALSQTYPGWLGWIVVVGGLGGAASGVIQARKTYVSLLTPRRTFARVQPTTKNRVDVGLRIEGQKSGGRLRPSTIHETMKLQISLTSVDDFDAEALSWLRKAYEENR